MPTFHVANRGGQPREMTMIFTAQRIAEFQEWQENSWAFPISFRQLSEAGVELNSDFDEDAGADDRRGEIVLTASVVGSVADDVQISYGVCALQSTLQRPEPHWTSCERVYHSASGSRDWYNRYANGRRIEDLWERLVAPEHCRILEGRLQDLRASDDD